MQDHEREEGIQADPFSHEKSPESSRRRECRPENRGRRQTTQEVREREVAGEAEREREKANRKESPRNKAATGCFSLDAWTMQLGLPGCSLALLAALLPALPAGLLFGPARSGGQRGPLPVPRKRLRNHSRFFSFLFFGRSQWDFVAGIAK